MKSYCDRCFKKTTVTIMSIFNTDIICNKCKEIEKQHPEYEKASKAELEEVKRGNYNYPGVGKPKDLI